VRGVFAVVFASPPAAAVAAAFAGLCSSKEKELLQKNREKWLIDCDREIFRRLKQSQNLVFIRFLYFSSLKRIVAEQWTPIYIRIRYISVYRSGACWLVLCMVVPYEYGMMSFDWLRCLVSLPEAVRHEQQISNAGWKKLNFAERDKWKPVLLRLSLARNLEKPLISLFGTEWRERGYGLKELLGPTAKSLLKKAKIFNKMKDVINSLCHE